MKAAIVISRRDNVATALETLAESRAVIIDGQTVVARSAIPSGHKIALVDIPQGKPVIKYGSEIGTAIMAIRAGEHVHTHNVASSRGRGDLGHGFAPPEDGARLAEPDDDAKRAEAVTPAVGSDG